MSRKFTFQVVLGGTITIEDTPGAKAITSNGTWRAQAEMDSFLRNALTFVGNETEVSSVSGSFVEKPLSAMDMFAARPPALADRIDTETPDISPKGESDGILP